MSHVKMTSFLRTLFESYYLWIARSTKKNKKNYISLSYILLEEKLEEDKIVINSKDKSIVKKDEKFLFSLNNFSNFLF